MAQLNNTRDTLCQIPGRQCLLKSIPRYPIITRHRGNRSVRLRSIPDTTVAATAGAATTSALKISDEVKRATAILKSGDATVHVLGISHVSKESCRHIRELISAVGPDAVLVELCKERTGLLLNQDLPPQRWKSPQVRLTGYTPKDGWPSQADLISGLKSSVNVSVSIGDIEDDVVSLLSTGLFRSVRPITRPPSPTDAPSFSISPTGKLIPIAPLGAIEFAVTERTLPSVAEFKIESTAGSLPEEVLQKAQKEALAENGPALPALLRARATLLQAIAGDNYNVVLSGVETGRVTAKIVPSGTATRVVSGLEGSAVKGQGFGIDMFTRQGKEEVRAAGFNIMLDDNTQVTASGSGGGRVSKSATPSTSTQQAVTIEPWEAKDVSVQRQAPPQTGIANSFAALLTQKYAFYQAEAGRKVGLSPGEAWRVSLEAAAASGASKVFLGDRPADVTGRRLAQGIWGSSAPFLFGAVPAAAVSAILTTDALQGTPAAAVAPIAAAFLPLFLALYPITSPLFEVQKFSKMTASQIEQAVSVKEPVQRPDGSPAPPMVLWGEDALLKWPGAMPSIINERDEYMARALAGLVAGKSEGLTPAFVRTVGPGEQAVFRYAMPRGADPGVCPVGAGAGRFEMGNGVKTVVAVVGTAHVSGIVSAWQRVTGPGGDVRLKEYL